MIRCLKKTSMQSNCSDFHISEMQSSFWQKNRNGTQELLLNRTQRTTDWTKMSSYQTLKKSKAINAT